MRQQNREYERTHINTNQNVLKPKSPHDQLDVNSSEKESNLKSTQPNVDSVPIPLEPIVIVKENKENSPRKLCPHVNAATEHQEHSMISDQTPSSDNTFVL